MSGFDSMLNASIGGGFPVLVRLPQFGIVSVPMT